MGELWTPEDKRKLKNMYNMGEDIKTMAIRFHRTEQAIKAQIKKVK